MHFYTVILIIFKTASSSATVKVFNFFFHFNVHNIIYALNDRLLSNVAYELWI